MKNNLIYLPFMVLMSVSFTVLSSDSFDTDGLARLFKQGVSLDGQENDTSEGDLTGLRSSSGTGLKRKPSREELLSRRRGGYEADRHLARLKLRNIKRGIPPLLQIDESKETLLHKDFYKPLSISNKAGQRLNMKVERLASADEYFKKQGHEEVFNMEDSLYLQAVDEDYVGACFKLYPEDRLFENNEHRLLLQTLLQKVIDYLQSQQRAEPILLEIEHHIEMPGWTRATCEEDYFEEEVNFSYLFIE